jgi:CDP-glucose 4,6-dehydratase
MEYSFWRDRPVLVTGATGLLGGWLVKELLEEGADVVALVRDRCPKSLIEREGLLGRLTVVQGDLRDEALLRRSLGEYSIGTVFHLAAQTLVGVAKRDPAGTLDVNIRGTWTVLEAARQAGTPQVIVASSDKAYGAQLDLPYTEAQPLQGRYPYDVSKSCADLICSMYATTYHLPVTVVRCANLFGGGDLNFSRLIPGLIQSTLKGDPFLIRSDGKFVRGYLYVKDAAHAYKTLARAMAERPELIGESFNFGMDGFATVIEIVHAVLKLMSREDLQPIVQNLASNEIREQYLSSEKALRMLGWKPLYGLEEALAETIEWYREFFTMYAAPLVAAIGQR